MNTRTANHHAEQIAIRLAVPSDAKELAKLRYAFRSSVSQATESEELFVERCTLWMQEKIEDDGPWRCWIAKADETTVGNIWAQIIEKIPNPVPEPERHGYITNLYVLEDWRGHSIGSMLLSAALTWIKTQDVHEIFLWPTERSRPLYLRHGFSVRDDLMVLPIGEGHL